jgi:hypothetical protein
MAQATEQANTKTENDRGPKYLWEKIHDLTTGTEILLELLDKVSSAIIEIPIEQGGDIMDEWMAANWVATRLREDARTVMREFNEYDRDKSE